MKYHKIQSIYKRDPENKFKTFLRGEYTTDAFEFLANCEWELREKIDGTNIRLTFDGEEWHIGGRTDNAQIPAHLFGTLQGIVKSIEDSDAVFHEGTTLYGEGIGNKIQKGGPRYILEDTAFVLFDVRVGDVWLTSETVDGIAVEHGLLRAPLVGYGTLDDAEDRVRAGFTSELAEIIRGVGDVQAEGIVARPVVELFDRMGRRVITKIKTRDYVAV